MKNFDSMTARRASEPKNLLPDFHEKTISSQNLIHGSYTVEINLGYKINAQKLMIIK